MRDYLLDNLVQAQQGIAPGDGMLFLLVALNFYQVTSRPVKRVMSEPVGEIDFGERVGTSLALRLAVVAP